MPRKSNKRSYKKKRRTKQRTKQRTKKQKPIMMIGCSKKNNIFSSLGNKGCSKCGKKCTCSKIQKGGSGCGSCGCPMSPLSWDKMNKFGGSNSLKGEPVLIDPSKQGGEYIPTFGVAQKGGTCAACGQGGGSSLYKPAGPMPGPILGSAWNTSVKEWPGMNGIGGDRNYLNSYASSITNDPQQQMSMSNSGYKTANSMVGGRRHRKTNKRGGGFIPTDLLNLGRNVNYSVNSAYNTFKGYNPPVNHLPYKDQLTGALNKASFI
jgi:hypothetical protein